MISICEYYTIGLTIIFTIIILHIIYYIYKIYNRILEHIFNI